MGKKKKKKPQVLTISENDLLSISRHVIALMELAEKEKASEVYWVDYPWRNMKVEIYDTDGGPGDLDLEIRITHAVHFDGPLSGYQEYNDRLDALLAEKPKRE